MKMPTEQSAAAGGGVLAEVLTLLAKATPGEWDAKADENEHGGWKPPAQEVSIYSGAKLIAHYETSFAEYPEDAENEANAEAIAAAVNYLRSHGLAIAELIAAVKCAVDLTPAEGRKDWHCHWGITTPDKCARCGPELRVIAALSNIEGGHHE